MHCVKVSVHGENGIEARSGFTKSCLSNRYCCFHQSWAPPDQTQFRTAEATVALRNYAEFNSLSGQEFLEILITWLSEQTKKREKKKKRNNQMQIKFFMFKSINCSCSSFWSAWTDLTSRSSTITCDFESFCEILLVHKIIKGLRQTSKIEAALLAQKSKAKLLLVKKKHAFEYAFRKGLCDNIKILSTSESV